MKKLKKQEIKFYSECFHEIMKMDKKDDFTKQLETLYILYKTDDVQFRKNIYSDFPKSTVIKIIHNFKIIDKHVDLTINKK